jgi:hypothetical protein
MRNLVSDKYILVSIKKLNPTEYGTFYAPYSAKECAIFDLICHTCAIFGLCHIRSNKAITVKVCLYRRIRIEKPTFAEFKITSNTREHYTVVNRKSMLFFF